MDEMKVTDLPDYKLEGITAADRNLEWLKDVKGHFKLLPVKPSDPTLEAGVMELTFTVTSEEGWVNEEGLLGVEVLDQVVFGVVGVGVLQVDAQGAKGVIGAGGVPDDVQLVGGPEVRRKDG